jgi:hypothetical protein
VHSLSMDGAPPLQIFGPPGTRVIVLALSQIITWKYPEITVTEYTLPTPEAGEDETCVELPVLRDEKLGSVSVVLTRQGRAVGMCSGCGERVCLRWSPGYRGPLQ